MATWEWESLRQRVFCTQALPETRGYSSGPERGVQNHDGNPTKGPGREVPNGLLRGAARNYPGWLGSLAKGLGMELSVGAQGGDFPAETFHLDFFLAQDAS